jgi:hypothetical protein
MGRHKKQKIKTNDVNSLEGLIQETYNDACANIVDAQKTINELVNSVRPEDVDDATKIAKEKNNALKVKDSAIRIKLEIAKLQSDIMKHKNNTEEDVNDRSGANITLDDFSKVRELIKRNAEKDKAEEEDEE